MNKQDELLINGYLDNELSKESALKVSQRLLAEPHLRAEFDAIKAVDSSLKNTLLGQQQATPSHIREMLKTEEKTKPYIKKLLPMGLAASVAAIAGALLVITNDTPDKSNTQSFDYALSTLPSSSESWHTISDNRQLQPALSFRSRDMHWCREYLLADNNAVQRGVACRENGRWHIKVQGAAQNQQVNNRYITASASDNDQIADFVEKNALDIPISSREEATLIASQWQH